MRDFEFRAWHEGNKDMISWNRCGGLLMLSLSAKNDHNFIWMQYTGLKDSKGVKVFEGDIVRFRSESDRSIPKKREGKPCEILIRMPFGVRVKFGDGWHYDWLKIAPTWDEFEIIGNVYENPELLVDDKALKC